jgi:hypothetical protein
MRDALLLAAVMASATGVSAFAFRVMVVGYCRTVEVLARRLPAPGDGEAGSGPG